MPKGEKFKAAEKHFMKKKMRYERDIKRLENQLDSAHQEIRHYRSLYEFSERNVEELNIMIDWLMKHKDLSREELKLACEKDGEMLNWLKMFGNFPR